MVFHSIIPKPSKISQNDGFFIINENTEIYYKFELEQVIDYFRKSMRITTGFELKTSIKSDSPNTICFIIDSNLEMDEEGYILRVTENLVEMRAKANVGIFYGIQTIRQLLPIEIEMRKLQSGISWKIPCVDIEDYPRFKWRGLMVDCCRHFFDIHELKKIINAMALHKLNIFHWHLTEDQGWRIEIKKYPKLTEIGSKRKETQIRHTRSKQFDGIPHGGFYTQDQIKDLIEYAKTRFITIIPEIEIPGHSQAAIASYPELSCTGEKVEVCTRFGVIRIVYCPGKEHTFTFWKDVLDEVIELFPSEIIHIGGDECPKDRWKECPDCQAKIEEENLKDEDDLQVFVTNSIASYLASKGRRLMGWNEILDDGLEINAVCHYWMGGDEPIIEHIKKGRDVVVSRNSHLYLDKNFESLPMKKIYSYDPMLTGLTKDEEKHVLGMESPLWSEWVPDNDKLEYQIFPRITAVAETSWSPKESKNFDDFSQRLSEFEKRLGLMNINYAPESDRNPNFMQKIKKVFGR